MILLQPLLCVLALAGTEQPAQRSPVYALANVRLESAADAPLSTILVRDGVIAAIQPATEAVPPEARVHDGAGLLALPAFIDAWSALGVATPAPTAERDVPPDTEADAPAQMRTAWRKGVQPAVRAANLFQPDAKELAKLREAGFGAVAAAPGGQYLAGRALVATLRDGAPRDMVVLPDAYECASFDAPGPGYPSTLMGTIAHLRQFFADAAQARAIAQRRAQGKNGPRPPYDADLAAMDDAFAGRRRIGFEASSADDIERALGLCGEFGLQAFVLDGRGSRDIAEQLAARRVHVVLSLEWPDEVEDPAKAEAKEPSADDAPWTYQEPLRAREDARRRWVERRDTALALREKGVLFAFACRGAEPQTAVERVRTLVAAGLPLAAAERALTGDAARILGVDGQLGALAPGKLALVALWSAHPLLDEKAELRLLAVEDSVRRHEAKPAKDDKGGKRPGKAGDEVAGAWNLVHAAKGSRLGVLTVAAGADGVATGELRFEARQPVDSAALSGTWKDGKLSLSAKLEVAGAPVEAKVEASLKDGALQGEFTWSGASGTTVDAFGATRAPKGGMSSGFDSTEEAR